MSNHTPGPWYVASFQTEDWRINISSETGTVAAAYHLNDDPCDPDKESEANAKLIAAAPELLKALEFYHGLIENLTQADRITVGLYSIHGWEEVAAVIAKAKGE